jgi:uncharacterized protein YaiI (UPF0178 family)
MDRRGRGAAGREGDRVPGGEAAGDPGRHNPFVRAVQVRGGPDEADRHIADAAEAGDLAITADIPLAADLVEKGVVVLDHRGDEFTAANVRERLSIRDFMESLRGAGVETGGPAAYGAKDKHAFAAALDRALTALVRGD